MAQEVDLLAVVAALQAEFVGNVSIGDASWIDFSHRDDLVLYETEGSLNPLGGPGPDVCAQDLAAPNRRRLNLVP